MSAKKQPKAKAVKAWLMFGDRHNAFSRIPEGFSLRENPVAVIDISNPDALVEQVAFAISSTECRQLGIPHRENPVTKRERVIAASALKSLGIIPARKAKK